VRRGEVWWARFPPRHPHPHPVLLLSWDSGYSFRNQITVAQITTTIRGLDAEVRLDQRDGMPQQCVANLDALATIPRELLIEEISDLSPERMREVEHAIHLALGIPLPCPLGEPTAPEADGEGQRLS
jgi:mRNA interferase MazF